MKNIFLFILVFFSFVNFSIAEILIGVGAPITGPSASFGEQIRQGVNAAAEAINQQGGVYGKKIRIVFGDDMADPRQGIAVANKFVAEGIQFVVGHFNSGVSIPASDVYAENGVLQITPSTTNPVYTDRGLWNVFRACGRDDDQAIVAANYIYKKFFGQKIAILHDKTPYGYGLSHATKKTLNQLGVEEVMYEGINPGEKDFSVLIGKMKNKGISVIYWGGLHTEAGLILRQMVDQKFKARLVSGDGIVSNELSSVAGDGVIGTLNTFGLDPTLNPENFAVLEKIKNSGFNPESYTLYSYAAIELIVSALRKTKSLDPKVVAHSLKSDGPFRTVLGEISFNQKGDAQLPNYMMYEWKKNEKGEYIYELQH